MADRTKAPVWTYLDETDIDSKKYPLADDFHSLERQIKCYTDDFNRETPFCMLLMRKHNDTKG